MFLPTDVHCILLLFFFTHIKVSICSVLAVKAGLPSSSNSSGGYIHTTTEHLDVDVPPAKSFQCIPPWCGSPAQFDMAKCPYALERLSSYAMRPRKRRMNYTFSREEPGDTPPEELELLPIRFTWGKPGLILCFTRTHLFSSHPNLKTKTKQESE